MHRVNVYRYPNEDDYDFDADGPILDGWFDLDKAERIDEDTYWDGKNQASVHTRHAHTHQDLYRTSGGRWVLQKYSNYAGTQPTYEFLTDEQVREWLIVNNSDDEIAKYFGQLAEEAGPATIGRPKSYGDPFPQRLEPGVQVEVDRLAHADGVSRAEMIRRLVDAGLAGQGATAYRA